MNEELKHKLLNTVGMELISKGFYLVVNAKKYLIFHRKTELYIEILQFAKERNETYFLVSSSIVYTKGSSKYSNLCYQAFKECNDGDINKISVDDCFKKYFLKGKNREKPEVRIKPELRQKVQFQRLNFMDDDFGLANVMNIIFCRNVLMYFDKTTQEAVLKKFMKYLSKGGYLFLGHSETIFNMILPLKNVAPTIFQKV